jgi:hypothetical protein
MPPRKKLLVVEEKARYQILSARIKGVSRNGVCLCVVVDLVMMRDRRWVGSRRYKQEPPEIFFPGASAKISLMLRKAKFLVDARRRTHTLGLVSRISKVRHPRAEQ